MTSVICWLGEEKNRTILWCAADSLISEDLSYNQRPYLEIISKISIIPIKIKSGPFLPPREITSLGFAFAGSTLIAAAVRDTLGLLLGNLQLLATSPNSSFENELFDWTTKLHPFNKDLINKLPSIKEIANLELDITVSVLSSVLKNTTEIQPSCEILIFGYCNKSKDFRCYLIHHEHNSPKIKIASLPLISEEKIYIPIVIGAQKEKIHKIISVEMRPNPDGTQKSRAPMKILKKIITDSDYPTIGGKMQIGLCSDMFGMTVYGFSDPADQDLTTYMYGFNPEINYKEGVRFIRQLGECFLSPQTLIVN